MHKRSLVVSSLILITMALFTASSSSVQNVSSRPLAGQLDFTTEAPVLPCMSKIAAVGDIDGSGLQTNSKLAQSVSPNHVILVGDVAYPDGRTKDFAELLNDPGWAALKPITHVVPGNHEYRQSGAAPFFKVFPLPIPRTVDLGCGWRLFLINSERGTVNTAAQLAWLKQQLKTAGPVVLAFHRPVKSSGQHGPSAKMKPFWNALDNRVSIIVSGHDHDAERFARSHNRLQIVTGLGGRDYRPFSTIRAGSAFRMKNRPAIWVAELMGDGSYNRRFVTTTGDRDVGINKPY